LSTDRETTRFVRSWLEEGVTTLPDRLLDVVLDQLPATPQRRSRWPAWRPNQMNLYAKVLAGAAAALVVAVAGYQLLAGRPGAGGPSVAPALTAAPPSPSSTQTPTASAVSPAPTRQAAFPSAGPLALGRHQVTVEGASFTLDFAEPGWTSGGDIFIGKGTHLEPDSISIAFWPMDPDFVYLDSCGEKPAQPVGPTGGDMAAAIAGMSQLELVSGPTSVTLDGNLALHVVVRVPDEIDCEPNAFWLWGDASLSRYASAAGSTFSVWIIDVNGNRVQIDAESFAGAGPEIDQEIQALIASIRFE
jgi:hypothetical protein